MCLRHLSWIRSTRIPLRLALPPHRQMPTLRLGQSLPSTRLKAKLAFWKLFCTNMGAIISYSRKKPYMSTDLANTIKETSRNVGYTARPTPGEAASPMASQHDNLKGPPSQGGRIQSRMAPGSLLGLRAMSSKVAKLPAGKHSPPAFAPECIGAPKAFTT